MRITAIEPAGRADVFNLEVEKTHDFVLANGVVAHNCYDDARYMCMFNPLPIRGMPRTPPRPYDPYEEMKHG